MLKAARSACAGLLSRSAGCSAVLQHHLNVPSAGLKTYELPPDYSDVVLPDKPKLKFLNKVPNLKKAKKEMKRLCDIQGPTKGSLSSLRLMMTAGV